MKLKLKKFGMLSIMLGIGLCFYTYSSAKCTEDAAGTSNPGKCYNDSCSTSNSSGGACNGNTCSGCCPGC